MPATADRQALLQAWDPSAMPVGTGRAPSIHAGCPQKARKSCLAVGGHYGTAILGTTGNTPSDDMT